MDLDELVLQLGNTLVEMKNTDVQILQVEEKTKVAKRLVIASAQDNQSAKKCAMELKELFKNRFQFLHMDGIIKGDWIVIDFKDVIVHIFTKEARQKYNLEKLWKDSKNCIFLGAKS